MRINRHDSPPAIIEKFAALDALRGLAAVVVAFFHWNFFNWIFPFYGWLVVDLFFVLSGFILCHRYFYKSNTTIYAFVVARFARLYPMHLFSLLLVLSASWIINERIPSYPDGTLFTFIQHLTLTHNIGLNSSGHTWNMPSWSISAEFWINVFFIGLIAKSIKSTTLLFSAIGALLVTINIGGGLDQTYKSIFDIFNLGLIRCWGSFALGVLSYRFFVLVKDLEVHKITALATDAITLAAAITLIFFLTDIKWQKLHFFAPFAFSALIISFALEKSKISKAISKAKHIGTISYSIYLNHFIIIIIMGSAVATNESPVVRLLIFSISTIALSILTYKYIELPGKRLIIDLLKPSKA